MEEFKNQLIGQKEGMLYALDLLESQKKALQKGIEAVDKKLKELK
ncbi:MAG: DUF5320 domain-containing protein [Clostridia bacterium]|nr:DUF5320 domain-containing protein [Clostridia bacterium]